MQPVLKQLASFPWQIPDLSCKCCKVTKALPCAGHYAPSQNSIRLEGTYSKELVCAATILRTKRWVWACNWTLLAVAFSTQQPQKTL